jgi:hypothetical protein
MVANGIPAKSIAAFDKNSFLLIASLVFEIFFTVHLPALHKSSAIKKGSPIIFEKTIINKNEVTYTLRNLGQSEIGIIKAVSI